jgi:hypothetical protein
MEQEWERRHIPEWAGQLLATLLTLGVTTIALAGVLTANSAGDDADPALAPIVKRAAPPSPPVPPRTVPGGPQPLTFVVVGSSEDRELFRQALAGDRMIRQVTGEPAREMAILLDDGTDLDVLRMVVAGDDAMLLAPPSVFIDLR